MAVRHLALVCSDVVDYGGDLFGVLSHSFGTDHEVLVLVALCCVRVV